MTNGIVPIAKVERRSGERRDGQRRAPEPGVSTALVAAPAPVEAVVDAERAASPAAGTAQDPTPTAFVAQVLGQGGARKGLRGGPPVLDAARSAYLETEYSGARERRPRPGKANKTEA